MWFKKKETSKDEKLPLTADDFVMITMINFPLGSVGEEVIHKIISLFTETSLFSAYRDMFKFRELKGGEIYSPVIHNAIERNCKHLNSGETFNNQTGESYGLFSDEIRFDLYDKTVEEEKEFAKCVPDYVPRVYYITGAGRSIAMIIMREKLNFEQREYIHGLGRSYDWDDTYIDNSDKK